QLSQEFEESIGKYDESEIVLPTMPTLALTPRQAFYAETEIIPLIEASHRISAESIMVYPPGIPIFIPGEIITPNNIDYIEQCKACNLPVQGTEDPTVTYIKVIK
ncbi:MAG: arginine decarboxylase, partial [Bacilli bacterium]